jgi:hypothetical protein
MSKEQKQRLAELRVIAARLRSECLSSEKPDEALLDQMLRIAELICEEDERKDVLTLNDYLATKL